MINNIKCLIGNGRTQDVEVPEVIKNLLKDTKRKTELSKYGILITYQQYPLYDTLVHHMTFMVDLLGNHFEAEKVAISISTTGEHYNKLIFL